ncbi:MAG: hypothetical protein ACRDQZ_23125 [Mycobacteriales bacterium]
MSGFFGGGTRIFTGGSFMRMESGAPRATTPVLSGSVIGGVPTLNWTASTIVDSTIDDYQIFREVDGTPPFTLLDTVDGATLTYADHTADPVLHSYTYYVVAQPDVGLDSNPSNQVTLSTPPLNVTVHVTAADNFEMPFSGTWETAGTGYSSDGSPLGLLVPAGSIDSTAIGTHTLYAICTITSGPPTGQGLMVVMPSGTSQDAFESVTIGSNTYLSADADYSQRADNGTVGAGPWQCWLWVTGNVDFTDGVTTPVTFNNVIT